MRKFFVILSGVYITILGIFIISTFSISIFLHLNKFKDRLPTAITGIFIFVMLGLWAVLTGIGIICKKNWARYSLFAMSFFTIFIGLICYLATFIPRAAVPDNTSELIFFAIPAVFLIAIPIYFLVFFNRRSIKELFVSKEQELKRSPRPLGITLIAILMFIAATGLLVHSFFPPYQKLPIFAVIFLSGISLKIYLLISAVINFYIAFGLFRLQKGGWIAYVIYSIFCALLGLVNTFTISEAALLEMMPKMKETAYQIPMIFYKISGIVGLLISLLLLAYVILKKRLFFKADDAQNVPS